jgi:hypothetical protein
LLPDGPLADIFIFLSLVVKKHLLDVVELAFSLCGACGQLFIIDIAQIGYETVPCGVMPGAILVNLEGLKKFLAEKVYYLEAGWSKFLDVGC